MTVLPPPLPAFLPFCPFPVPLLHPQAMVEVGIGLGVFAGDHIGIGDRVRILTARGLREAIEWAAPRLRNIKIIVCALPAFRRRDNIEFYQAVFAGLYGLPTRPASLCWWWDGLLGAKQYCAVLTQARLESTEARPMQARFLSCFSTRTCTRSPAPRRVNSRTRSFTRLALAGSLAESSQIARTCALKRVTTPLHEGAPPVVRLVPRFTTSELNPGDSHGVVCVPSSLRTVDDGTPTDWRVLDELRPRHGRETRPHDLWSAPSNIVFSHVKWTLLSSSTNPTSRRQSLRDPRPLSLPPC